MHNWWIAALESAGIWTEEQAQHVSDHIKTTIHRDTYTDAKAELQAILSSGKFGVGSLTNVEAEINALKAKVALLTEQLATKVEEKIAPKEPIAK